MQERIVSGTLKDEDYALDAENNLRPRSIDEYIGQTKVKETIRLFIQAARGRGEPLDHVLLYGPPGLGKTTLANIIANEMSVNIRTTSGPAVERPGDLAALLTNLSPGDVLFIDEIHRLSNIVEEVLYPAMEDSALDIIIGKGPSARSIRIDLPRFTLVGATTRAGLLTSPLRDRFGVIARLDFYHTEELTQIVRRSAELLKVQMTPEGAVEIAKRSRGTPRVANRFLRRVRDFAEVRAEGIISGEVAVDALDFLDVDKLGLDNNDRRILRTLTEKFGGGPVGLDTLAASINEESDTIEDIYEPYLMQMGLLARTPRGRIATEMAYRHLNMTPPSEEKAGQRRLWDDGK